MERHVEAIVFLTHPNENGTQEGPFLQIEGPLCIFGGQSPGFRFSFGLFQMLDVGYLQRKSIGGRLNNLDGFPVNRVECSSPDFVATKSLNHATLKHLQVERAPS